MDFPPDPYPSRRQPAPSMAPRRDPVVYGRSPEPDGLLPETLERYRREGFLSFDHFLDRRSLRSLVAEMERLRTTAAPGDPEVVMEPGGDSVRSIFAIHRRSPRVGRLVREPRLLGPVRQILGGPVYVHQSRVNYKSGFDGAPFYWHSDFETWHVEDGMPAMRALSVQISLTENTPLNGPLMLIPGSHLHYVACVGETPDDHYRTSLRRQEYGVPDPALLRRLVENGGGIVAPTGPAGSMVLFDCNTIHGSNSNITPLPRTNLFIVYNSVENGLAAPFGGTRPRPSFVAAREVVPL